MRSRLLSLAALFLFASAVRADDAADARAIVEKGVKALGHKPGDKLEALTWKDNGKFSGGGMAMPYTGEFAYQWPDKYRFAVNADLEGMKLTFIGRRLKSGAPYLNLTERANIVSVDTGKEIYRTANFGEKAPEGPKGTVGNP